MDIKDKIKQIRNNNKLSQKEFASLLGETQQSISQFENGERIPGTAVLIKLSEKLKINLNWLLLDIGDMELSEYESSVHLNEKIKFLEKEVQVYREILEMNDLIKKKPEKR